jgi:hypothetical protein
MHWWMRLERGLSVCHARMCWVGFVMRAWWCDSNLGNALGSRTLNERAVFQLRLIDALRSLTDPLEVQRGCCAISSARIARATPK